MGERGIWLTCQKCGKDREMRRSGKSVLHSTSNQVVVAWFRRQGWSCTTNGYRARCPRCDHIANAANEPRSEAE